MWNKLIAFYNKNDFNYSTGLVDPFEFHMTFYKIIYYSKVADLHKNKWMNQNIVVFFFGSTALILSALSFVHGLYVFEILHLTETWSYCILMFYQMVIISCIKLNSPQYVNLLKAMKEDFYYICTEGEKYRKKFFEIQLETWKICIVTCAYFSLTTSGMVLFSIIFLVYFFATSVPGDEKLRPILFPFWLPDIDFHETPYYEISFVFADITVSLYTYSYLFMMQTQIVWVRHIASKVDIIVWSIQDLLLDVYPEASDEEKEHTSKILKERLRKIVKHHQSMLSLLKDYALVYKKLLLYEQKCAWPVICLTAYCTSEKFAQGEFQPILSLLCLATLVVFFIPSYLCTFMAFKVSSICDACWDTPFWNASPVIRPYMVLIMQRSLQPIPLQAPGFDPISMETFSQKMSSSYSMFNMLRKININ